jgi:hypothetical protein
MNSPFNPLQYVRQLEDAGVPNNQAEVHANTLAKVLDNYAQLQEVKQEVTTAVAASEFRVRAEIVELQAQLKAQIADVAAKSRAEIAEAMAGLRAEIAEAEARLRAEITDAEARLRTEFNTRMDKLEAKMQGLRRTNAIIIALAVAILAQGYFK